MKEGQYYYRRHRRMWGVWINHNFPSGISTGDFVGDFPSQDAAEAFVYEKNGWKKK